MYEKEKRKQEELAKKVLLEDRFRLDRVGGVDEAFINDRVISAVVVLDEKGKITEKKHAILKINFPYIPGLLSFREGKPIERAVGKLRKKPTLLFVNGCGIIHPRFCGLASHIGVELGIPTIGVTQNLLCGKCDKPPVGGHTKITYKGRVVGFSFRSSKRFRPIFISPGHMVGLSSSLLVVKSFVREHKLPEPLWLAHKYANSVKKAEIANL